MLLLCFSTQADDRVRIEKRDCTQFEFASAMNTITEFYCHSQEQGVFIFLCNLLYSVFGPDTLSQQDQGFKTFTVSYCSVCVLLSVKTPCLCLCSPQAAARCQV